MCHTCTFAIQCYAVANTEDKQNKTLTAYVQHLKFGHRMNDKTIALQVAGMKHLSQTLAGKMEEER